MTATEELLSNIKEYHQLLGFLNEKHPEILKEWSNGPSNKATTSNPTNWTEGMDYEQYSNTSK